MVTNPQSGTNVHEIASGIYRINTPIQIPGGPGFNFNQYLLVDDEALLFHTGPRRLFPFVREAIAKVMPLERLAYIGLSHFEADECGAMNELLAVAPRAVPLCSRVAAMVSVNDVSDRPARAMADGETLALGRHTLRWIDTPHMPHGWECGLMMETSTGTLLCGDLFTHVGDEGPVTEQEIVDAAMAAEDMFGATSLSPQTGATLRRLAELEPTMLALMHGASYRGDGAAALRSLADRYEARLAVPA